MVTQTQTIRRQQPINCLSVFDLFVGLALEGLRTAVLLTVVTNKIFYDSIITV